MPCLFADDLYFKVYGNISSTLFYLDVEFSSGFKNSRISVFNAKASRSMVSIDIFLHHILRMKYKYDANLQVQRAVLVIIAFVLVLLEDF